MIVKYVRTEFLVNDRIERHPVACMVGDIVDGKPFVTVATCSLKDHFSKKVGRELAIQRFNERKPGKIPRQLAKIVDQAITQFYGRLYRKQNEL
jgi:hypothetical protein